MPKLHENVLSYIEKKVDCKHLYYVCRFMRKVDHKNDKFIHVPTNTYNKVMWLLKLGVVECE